MSLLDTLRKLRGTGASINQDAASLDAEIAKLRAEEAELSRKPLPFDDWLAHLLESVEHQANEAPVRQLAEIKRALVQPHSGRIEADRDGAWKGPTHFGTAGLETNWDALSMIGHQPTASGTAGLSMPLVLFLLKDRLMTELPAMLEPLRAEWPEPSECGPTRAARQKRMAEIRARIAELESIKAELVDAARALLGNLEPGAIQLPADVRRRA